MKIHEKYLTEKTDPKRVIEQISRNILDIPTLKVRGMDDKDFHEVDVISVKKALTMAFEAGKKYAQMFYMDDACNRYLKSCCLYYVTTCYSLLLYCG